MKEKFYSLYGKAVDSSGKEHIVTVVGKLEQKRKRVEVVEKTPVCLKPQMFVEGELKFSRKILNRKLTVGMSICHPLDKFDEEIGIEVAKSRIKHGENLGFIETSCVTMLTKDAILADFFVKLQHIINNIENFLP